MARDNHLNAALEIHLAWGPERARPLHDRFREKMPDLAAEDCVWLERQCDAILSAACRLADEIGQGRIAAGDAHAKIAAEWPSLDAARIGQAMHQGYYSFWRDNGRSPEEAAARLKSSTATAEPARAAPIPVPAPSAEAIDFMTGKPVKRSKPAKPTKRRK